jgi:DNA-binding FadR family transcriptional regulator
VAQVPKLHQVVLADMLAAIVRGDYEEGAKLPSEQVLADDFDVSRYVARQAIQALRDRGLIAVTHGVGQFVEPRHRWNLFDPVLFEGMLAGDDSAQASAEARECSAMVWPEVAALAAERRTEEELERLEAAADVQRLRNALVAAAHNRFLGQVVSTVDRAAQPPHREDLEPVVRAVRKGDAKAARAAMAVVVGA